MITTRDEPRKIRLVVVDDVAETRDNIRKLLYFEDDIEIIGAASNGREGIELAIKVQPDIVLMDINMPETDGIAASEAISAQAPNVQIIMMSVQGEADYLRRSMLAGAREFLIKPFSSDELTTSIRRVHQLASTRHHVSAPPPPPVAETPGSAPKKPTGAKIIAVYSPKGGTGASTIAVNLALAIREETQQRVALIDASLQYGDIGLILNLPTHRSISDLIDSKTELDEDLLNGIMAGHSSGVKVLLAPPRPELAELVSPEAFKNLLHFFQLHFDYVVIDTGKGLNDVLLTAFDAAEQIILVATSDLASLKNCKLYFDVSEALHYPASKTVLVLNKEEGKGISLSDIENNLKHPVSGVLLRDDKTVNAALNRGVPFVVGQRATQISQNIFQLARLVKRESVEAVAVAPSPNGGKPSAPPEKNQRRGLFSFGKK